MPLSPGSTLGPYTVTAKIGEGGMGEVWQATDTKLKRQVALKILPDAFSADPDRLARFQREAQILASLNHPNIAAIHGLEESDGQQALVLELVQGPTLADRVAQGPIPIDDALPIAKQIAEALEAAHEAGVIHRDLKPANIKVKEDGTVKVLDFGLAKALETTRQDDPNQSPTLTAAVTQMGAIMGTAAYMAPEQAMGKVVDKRADIWAFGAVLFEMLTGQKPFVGDDVSDTLAAVLRAEVDMDDLPAETPVRLRQVLAACLQRDPKQRVHDVADVRLAMEGAFETTASASPPRSAQPAGWRQALPLGLGISVVAVVITGLAVWTLMQPESPRVVRSSVSLDDAAPLFIATTQPDIAISPDGARIAYLTGSDGPGGERLHVRPLDQFTSDTLVAEGVLNGPFFSPDGESVGFYDRSANPRLLQRVSVRGGPRSTICEFQSELRGASWGDDDTIIFSTSRGPLLRVSAAGGEPEQLTTPDTEQGEVAHLWPEILPGGRAVLFTIRGDTIEDAQIAVLSLDTGEQTIIVRGSHPRYSSTGHVVYGVDGTLWAVPFDLDRLEAAGDAVPMVEGVLTKASFLSGATSFDLSDDGSLVYVTESAAPEMRGTLVWVDREGQASPVVDQPAVYDTPRISPDGSRIAVTITDGDNLDVWVIDADRGTRTRLTSDAARDLIPLWTPDGTRITFSSNRGSGTNSLYWKAADGNGSVERLTESQSNQGATSWSSDGSTLLFYEVGDSDVLTLVPGEEPIRFRETEFVEQGPTFSPDGRWLAYSSNGTGQWEVYVTPYPGPGGTTLISTEGGRSPRWSADGRELFYRNGDEMIVVAMVTEPRLQIGTPQILFSRPFVQEQVYIGAPNYDVAPDGQRFIMMEAVADEATTEASRSEINIVLNWFQELIERVPVN